MTQSIDLWSFMINNIITVYKEKYRSLILPYNNNLDNRKTLAEDIYKNVCK